jgi:PAS domain-containing protein
MSLLAAQRGGPPWRRRLVALLHAGGVVGLGFLWHACGGLQNPAFLLAFALPVIGASGLSRGQPYVTAVLALLIVGAVGLTEAPELRWYVADLRTSGHWLALLSPTGGAAGGTFAGFYAPVGYDVTLLEVFAILLMACAIAAESLGYAFQRLVDHLGAVRAEASQAQQLWAMLLQQLPAPALLVDSETLQVLVASERFQSFLGGTLTPIGRPLLEALPISYPERLQEMVSGHGGSLTVVLRTPERLRLAQLQVQQLLSDGRRLAVVLLEDNTAGYCIGAALDADEHATLVIDPQGRVLASNKPARGLFPAALPGTDATAMLLPLVPGTARWWEPGLPGRRRLQLSIARRRYQALCSTVALPGEEQGFYVIALAPAWLGASSTMVAETLASEMR